MTVMLMYIKRGFIPSQRKGFTALSRIIGLFRMSTIAKQIQSQMPEKLEVKNAKETDHLFLQTESPITARPPITAKPSVRMSHYFNSVMFVPLLELFFLMSNE